MQNYTITFYILDGFTEENVFITHNLECKLLYVIIVKITRRKILIKNVKIFLRIICYVTCAKIQASFL